MAPSTSRARPSSTRVLSVWRAYLGGHAGARRDLGRRQSFTGQDDLDHRQVARLGCPFMAPAPVLQVLHDTVQHQIRDYVIDRASF